MATITSSGSASGLNVASLVSQLVAADRAPYDARITKADTKLTTEFTALSKLKAAMSSFQAALGALKDSTNFTQRKVTTSDKDAIEATASGSAAAGTYDVEVVQLAKSAQLASSPFVAGSSAVIGTGTLQLSMGTASFNVTIAEPKNTLADVRDAINSATGNSGIRASLIKAADGTRLVLTGAATGAANAIKVTASGGNGGLNQLVYDPPTTANLASVVAARDAVVNISGYEVHSSDNVIEDSIDGVTLTLKQEEEGKVMTLSIDNDDAAVQTKVQNFVSAYNVLANQISSLRSYDAATKTAGPLLGDSMLRGIEAQLRRTISDPAGGVTGAYSTLASIGITTTSTGTLALDATKYAAAMKADSTAAQQVFSSTDGVARRLDTLLSAHLATGGDIATRDAGITQRRKDLTAQQAAVDARMEVIEARYTKQFNALDSLLTSMQSTSTYLAQQLGTSSST